MGVARLFSSGIMTAVKPGISIQNHTARTLKGCGNQHYHYMKYFFILGNQPDLARAEIEAVLRRMKITGQVTAVESTFLFLETETELSATELIATLGGTIKIGQVLGGVDVLNAESISRFLPTSDKKIIFGISNYNLFFNIQKIGLELKHLIKNEGGAARFVTSKEYPLSSVIVQKEILNKGMEIVIMKTGGALYVGQTLAEQPLDATILDPFCGSGTVLQQAVFLGYKKVLGSDSSARAVEDTRVNMNWLAEKFNVPFDLDVKQVDVQALPRMIDSHSIDAIVTEPYLGPALRGGETSSFLERTTSELATLYRQALRAMNAALKPQGVIIIIVPELCSKYQSHTLPMDEILPTDLTVTGHWQYSRPEQKVVRHIYKIIKT